MCINGEIGSGGLGGGADCAVWLYERAVGRRTRFKRNPGFNGQNR